VSTGELKKRILAHRGVWGLRGSSNSPEVLTEALAAGFGIETDLRDHNGRIVVSHDPPTRRTPLFADLLEQWARENRLSGRILALNVKSDGLVPLLSQLDDDLKEADFFFFDMSFPQLLSYSRAGLPVALRISEFEPAPVDLSHRLGMARKYWLDGFDSDWWVGDDAIEKLVRESQVTVVSPELHGRSPSAVWDWFLQRVAEGCDLYLCTDSPWAVVERA